MNLTLEAITNSKESYINNLVLYIPSEYHKMLPIDEKLISIVIDRNNTEIVKLPVKDFAHWKDIYIWDGEKAITDEELIKKAFERAVGFSVNIEEDAPEDYKFDCYKLTISYPTRVCNTEKTIELYIYDGE